MTDLSGRVALVMGAGSGPCRRVALALAAAGADVAVSDRSLLDAMETAGEIRLLGRRAMVKAADLQDRAAAESVVAAAVHDLGAIDILVGGATPGAGGALLTMPEAAWEHHVSEDLRVAFLAAQAVARQMVRQQRGGRIIAITSLAATPPQPGFSAGAAADAAIRAAVDCWAAELAAFGITANSLGPSLAPAPGPGGSLDELERLACWLASGGAAHITGTHTAYGEPDSAPAGVAVAPALLVAQAAGLSGDALLAALDAASASGGPAVIPQLVQ